MLCLQVEPVVTEFKKYWQGDLNLLTLPQDIRTISWRWIGQSCTEDSIPPTPTTPHVGTSEMQHSAPASASRIQTRAPSRASSSNISCTSSLPIRTVCDNTGTNVSNFVSKIEHWVKSLDANEAPNMSGLELPRLAPGEDDKIHIISRLHETCYKSVYLSIIERPWEPENEPAPCNSQKHMMKCSKCKIDRVSHCQECKEHRACYDLTTLRPPFNYFNHTDFLCDPFGGMTEREDKQQIARIKRARRRLDFDGIPTTPSQPGTSDEPAVIPEPAPSAELLNIESASQYSFDRDDDFDSIASSMPLN